MHIGIVGNIGAGKTTLAHLLAQHYDWEVLCETVDTNPYLAAFYANMPQWAFHTQIYFLNSRFKQIIHIKKQYHKTIIQDRTIYEDAYIFAKNLYKSGQMTEIDYNTYYALFQNILSMIQPPDLMLYLKADLPILKERIRKRGRAFELNIPDQYLEGLNQLYDEFSQDFKHGHLLTLDVNNMDFLNNNEDFIKITRQLEEQLNIRKQLKF